MKKIAAITCYFDPDYVRARTLRAALASLPDIKIIVVKNRHKGGLRYPEIVWKIWQTKRREKPDAYLLTFRGQEILPLVLLLAGRKPVWFDEFIVPIAYATGEQHQKSFAIMVKHALARLATPLYKNWLKHCRAILADTQRHAEVSARSAHMNMRKYLAVPVGTDEKLFTPVTGKRSENDRFTVFYYSTGMQPLHGIPTVLEAAKALADKPEIEFYFLGGKEPMRRAVMQAQAEGANVRYDAWLPFDQLPKVMQEAGVCLGGPFGGTPQAMNVVTGKTYQMLACAAPVIIGASQATEEYFTNKENALIVPQADAKALRKAVLWACQHQTELAEIGQKGRKLYERQFSTVAIARRLQPLVDAL